MKSLQSVLPFVLGGALLLAGCNGSTPSEPAGEKSAKGPTEEPGQPEESLDDIVETAVAADGFETLVTAIKAAGLVETLKGTGPFTVFAPTDEAFGKLPEGTLEDLLKPENKDKLTSILTYHVVPNKVLAAQVVKLDSAKTVQGGEVAITVEDESVKVDGANVTATDIECSNGVIHVIDAVLMPK